MSSSRRLRAATTVLAALAAAGSIATAHAQTTDPPANRPPVAVLTSTSTTGQAPFTIAFYGSASSDPDGPADLASWTLDFGDGSPKATGTGAPPTVLGHEYAPGTTTATLTVRDTAGATSTASLPVTVTAYETTLVADPLLTLRLSARLTRSSSGTPIAGATLTFFTANSPALCAAKTDANGRATCRSLTAFLNALLVGRDVRVTFVGTDTDVSATARATLLSRGQ